MAKTSIVDQAIAHTIDEEKPVFLFSREMPERISATGLIQSLLEDVTWKSATIMRGKLITLFHIEHKS